MEGAAGSGDGGGEEGAAEREEERSGEHFDGRGEFEEKR